MAAAEGLRVGVRVRPGASRTKVGGSYGVDESLVVAVSARAVDGAANLAVITVIAEAFGVRRSAVTVVVGQASRSKVVSIEGDPTVLAERLLSLLDGAPR